VSRIEKTGTKKKKDAPGQSIGDRSSAKIKSRILEKSEEYRAKKCGIFR
jgi:hypothetical protein